MGFTSHFLGPHETYHLNLYFHIQLIYLDYLYNSDNSTTSPEQKSKHPLHATKRSISKHNDIRPSNMRNTYTTIIIPGWPPVDLPFLAERSSQARVPFSLPQRGYQQPKGREPTIN